MKLNASLFIVLVFSVIFSAAQQKKITTPAVSNTAKQDSLIIPVSKADLGIFPYFKTLPNFFNRSGDSITYNQNKVYFYDGKSFFAVIGKTSRQVKSVYDYKKKYPSIFECINEYDKLISALGGKKIYTGKLPEDKLKAFAGEDMVSLGSRGQLVTSAYYGLVEYVIKTPEKEVWIQLVPYSMESYYYSLLIVEKEIKLVDLNTNKPNQILADLLKNKKATVSLYFEPDTDNLLSQSKDELLSMLGVFQSNPSFKIIVESHNAPVGTPEYNIQLTQKRADKIKSELTNSGVKSENIEAIGKGDRSPIVKNDTEKGLLTNTRIELILK